MRNHEIISYTSFTRDWAFSNVLSSYYNIFGLFNLNLWFHGAMNKQNKQLNAQNNEIICFIVNSVQTDKTNKYLIFQDPKNCYQEIEKKMLLVNLQH